MRWVIILFLAMPVSAADVYFAATAQGANNGTSCANAYAYTDGTNGINTAGKWVAGNNLHLCGTITGAANTTLITAAGNGSAGNPITIVFEPSAILQAPYFPSSVGGTQAGAITLGSGRSYITVDGKNTGTIQTTANGTSLANQQASTLISAFNCSHCIVQNFRSPGSLGPVFVSVTGSAVPGGDDSVFRSVDLNGSNWTITNNTIHDGGWCLVDFFNNADTSVTISGNDIYNCGHGMAIATSGANALTNVFISGNTIHDAAIWSPPSCTGAHDDGIHFFGTTGSSIDQVFISNNYFYGDWGTCPTAFLFDEGDGSSTPTHMKTIAVWNNVFVVPNATIVNTNSWVDMESGDSGTQTVVDNTFVGFNSTDNTLCFRLSNLASLTYENNTISPCGDPIRMDSTTITAANFNAYGPSCGNGGNCFVWNSVFQGSFAAWKTATSAEASSLQNNLMKLNADGSQQSGSPVIGAGTNLSSIATGNLASLQNDTTKGGTRTAVARPGGATAWDIGAYFNAQSSTFVTVPSVIWP